MAAKKTAKNAVQKAKKNIDIRDKEVVVDSEIKEIDLLIQNIYEKVIPSALKNQKLYLQQIANEFSLQLSDSQYRPAPREHNMGSLLDEFLVTVWGGAITSFSLQLLKIKEPSLRELVLRFIAIENAPKKKPSKRRK